MRIPHACSIAAILAVAAIAWSIGFGSDAELSLLSPPQRWPVSALSGGGLLRAEVDAPIGGVSSTSPGRSAVLERMPARVPFAVGGFAGEGQSDVDAQLGLVRVALREWPGGVKQWRFDSALPQQSAWRPVVAIRGQVVGESDQSVADVSVFMARRGGRDPDPWVQRVRSSEDGSFQFPDSFSDGASVLIAVRHDGACSMPVEIDPAANAGLLSIRLRLRAVPLREVRVVEAYPGPSLVGRICGLDPASGARVEIVPDPDGLVRVPDHGGDWRLWPDLPLAPGIEHVSRPNAPSISWKLPGRSRILVRWNGSIDERDEVVVRCVVYGLDSTGAWRTVLSERFRWATDAAPMLSLLPGDYRLRLDASGCASFLSEVLRLGPGESALVDGSLRPL